MAFCPNCGAANNDGSSFCSNCGAAMNASAQQNSQQYQQNQYQQNQYQYQQYQYQQNAYQQYQYQYRQPGYGPAGISFGQRNIAVAIILSIVTCGIYGIYWFVKMVDEVNEAACNQGATTGGMTFLLSLVTCGIYALYWYYKAGEYLYAAKSMRGMYRDSNSGIVFLLLGIFGLSIITYALIQSELNEIAAYHGAPRA